MKVKKRVHPLGERGVFYSLEAVAQKAAEGGSRPDVRRWAIDQLDAARKRGLNINGQREQAEELLKAVQKKLWISDPVGTEFIQGAHLTACTPEADMCFAGGDCFPQGTLVLTDAHELKPIESVRAGDRIWGLNKWSEVQASAYKGVLSVDVLRLSNGSDLALTPDHHVYVLDCTKHSMVGDESVAPCSCALESRTEARIRVSEVREGMVLPYPERVPFGKGGHVPRAVQMRPLRRSWLLRVRSIEREVYTAPCWDIQTDDHRVYLPEHDVTVSQCDDLTVLLAAAYLSVGLDTVIVGHSYDNMQRIGHVLCAVHAEGKWHYADASIYTKEGDHYELGKCGPFTRETLHELPSAKLICDGAVCIKGGNPNPGHSDQWAQGGIFVGVDGNPLETTKVPTPKDFSYRVQWINEPTLGQLGDAEGKSEFQQYAESIDPTQFYSSAKYREDALVGAASIGAGAACAASGAGAVATPVCAAVGGAVAKAVISIANSLFGSDDAEKKRQQAIKDRNAYLAANNESFILGQTVQRDFQASMAAFAMFSAELGRAKLNSATSSCPATTVAFSKGGGSYTFPSFTCLEDERAVSYLYSKHLPKITTEKYGGDGRKNRIVFKWYGYLGPDFWAKCKQQLGASNITIPSQLAGSTAASWNMADIHTAAFNYALSAMAQTTITATGMFGPISYKVDTSLPTPQAIARTYANEQVRAVADHYIDLIETGTAQLMTAEVALKAHVDANKALVEQGKLKQPGDDKPATGTSAGTKLAVAAVALTAAAVAIPPLYRIWKS